MDARPPPVNARPTPAAAIMRRVLRPAPGWLLPLVALTALACGVYAPGLPRAKSDAAPTTDAAVPETEDAPPPDRRPELSRADRLLDVGEPVGIEGPPATVGCADGTREGFTSLDDWPAIAGCSGAWQVPGAMGLEARQPRCDRQGGNTGRRADGEGCSVADLCAEGWHVCADAGEVTRVSPSGCESALRPGEGSLFVVAAGASQQGLCLPDPAAANDLHGCGDESLGQPESAACQPLERRMGFADCAATGVWSCGTADDHLREAGIVTKRDSRLGGVLCCRD
jgi:hypothetical protein